MATSTPAPRAPKTAPESSAQPRTDGETSERRRSGRGRRSSGDPLSAWRPAIEKLDEAERRVAKILTKSATPLPEGTARSIVLEVLSKSLEAGFPERTVWDAVVEREKKKLEELERLRNGAGA